jgi:hypothetical protein
MRGLQMSRRNRLMCLFLSIVVGGCWAVEIKVPIIDDNVAQHIYTAPFRVGSKILFDAGLSSIKTDIEIDINKDRVSRVTELQSMPGYNALHGAYGNLLLVTNIGVKDNEEIKTYLQFDPESRSLLHSPITEWLYTIREYMHVLYYQNGIFFSQYDVGSEDSSGAIVGVYKYNSLQPMESFRNTLLLDMSNDKIHLLLLEPGKWEIATLYNIQTKKKIDFKGEWANNWVEYHNVQFLTNNLIITFKRHPNDDNFDPGEFEIYDIKNPNKKVDVKLTLELKKWPGRWQGYYFFKNGARAIIQDIENGAIYADTSGLMKYLNSLGLIFRSTQGTLNNSNVRLRENPNQEAQTLRLMNKGEKVTAIDRSGLREKIGQVSDWWYQVQTSDNLMGWIYGQYLDLDEKQGDFIIK